MKRVSQGLALAAALAAVGCRQEAGVGRAARIADSAAAASAGRPAAVPVRLASPAGPVAWLGCEVVGPPCEPIGLVPPGASAHSWEPRPSDVARLEGVDAWLRTGLAFEGAWTERFHGAFPKLPMLDLRGAMDLRNADHDHGEEPMDPHVWTSPRAMAVLAETLATRLSAARPDLAARVRGRMPRVRSELASLDSFAREQLAPWSGRTFLVNHPGLGYLARDYGLVQMALEEHGRELSPVALFELRRVARSQGIKTVFVQPEASDRTARAVAEDLGVPLATVHMLAPPWDSAFRAAVRTLAQGL